ncbi:MAG: N-acetylmuramoyl-L-alanine amidase family protein [Acidimicrobiales bacterium]
MGTVPPAQLARIEPESASVTASASASAAVSTTTRPAPTTTTATTTATTTTTTRPTTTAPPPIELGTQDSPFVPLPHPKAVAAIVTSSGVVLPVIEEHGDGWLVSTPCQNTRLITDGQPLGRAHVVLDPGHGGAEPGAVGQTGLTEKDLNLLVANLAAQKLEAAGATVVLARTADYTITAASRGRIAAAIAPALFVSIHHNGGAPAGGERPGTIVFTKTGSAASERFGGLFNEQLQPMLAQAAEPKIERYRQYAEALDGHEALIAAYDQSVAARDQALVANGQIPPELTTTIPVTTATVEPGQIRLPSVREPVTTTTLPLTPEANGGSPLPVPETVAAPPPFAMEPVREFSWAGTGNAGVRSWTRVDGHDYLAVLRHSGSVPAALVEFVYLSNPAEEELLADSAFVEAEADALAKAIIRYFANDGASGTGHVQDQFDDQPIGGSGGVDNCVEPEL